MPAEPSFSSETGGDSLRLRLAGQWTVEAPGVEQCADALATAGAKAPRVVMDVSGVEEMDTAGAWLIDRARVGIANRGADATLEGARRAHEILLREAHFRAFETPPATGHPFVFEMLEQIGFDVATGFRDVFQGVAFLGQVVATLARAVAQPWRLRVTSIVRQMEIIGFQGIPIIALINFITGCIVAQQGIYQLRRFGAPTYAVDLLGILMLRELGVLMSSIMIAGRSGSAITAELGSMKMREEIDALRVMGLDPVEVLVVPRVVALVLCLPLLTFVADMAGLFGGLLVFWGYQGINPAAYTELMKDAIAFNTFMTGLIKAPFMGLTIAVTAAIEGFAVQGSSESLGRQVTASVVKSIFMVIVIDGFFAVYFATIKY